MSYIFYNNSVRIKKRTLGQIKRDPMLSLIFSVFPLIPFEAYFSRNHYTMLGTESNINVWQYIWNRNKRLSLE